MCGIAGIFSKDPRGLNEVILKRMQVTIRHRGPDDLGLVYLPEQGIGLAHTRLSVIDLTPEGRQPMWNAVHNVVLVFNGEVYNFREIRSQLESCGYAFRSKTDTEVILHGYEEWGIDVIHRLNGMFALGLWDSRLHRLYLVRDRLGKKPLYYWYEPVSRTLVFASEIKAILQHPWVERKVSPEALHCYLELGYVPAPYTMIQQILKLPPAHMLLIEGDGEPIIQRYWNVEKIGRLHLSASEHRRQVRTLVEAAVERRLISDVPLGVFLSGGIDSTIVVGIMSRLLKEPVRTFSAAFDVGTRSFKYNVDADMADYVSRYFSTHHTRLTIALKDNLIATMRRVVYHVDEPHSNPTLVTTYLLAEYVKQQGITVMLTGDGSDEIFGGYHRYRYDRVLDYLRLIPSPMRIAIGAIANCTGRAHRIRNVLRKADGAPLSAQRYLGWWTIFPADLRAQILSPEWRQFQEIPQQIVSMVLKYAQTVNNQEAISYTDLRLWLAEESNMRVDKMTMAHALESRSPFQDYALVEYAMQIPFRQKARLNNYKKLLKETFTDLLPKTVLDRPKLGWNSPVYHWVRTILKKEAQQLIMYLPSTGIFTNEVQSLLEEKDYSFVRSNQIWSLVVFALWFQIFIEDNPTSSTDEE